MRVVVLGAGALGTLYGAWSAMAGHAVTLVGRDPHCREIATNGLRVVDRDGVETTVPAGALTHPYAAPGCDVLLLACKAHDTSSLLRDYPATAAAAWSVQNGVHQAQPLVERFGGAAIGCSSMVGATLVRPGVVEHTFSGATYLGALTTSSPEAVDAVVESLGPAVAVEVRADIDSVLWSKAVLATGAMGVSALLRLPYHHVFTEPGARQVFLDLVREAAQITRAEGFSLVDLPGPLQVASIVSLPPTQVLERLRVLGEAMLASGQTSVRVSMLQSIETGRNLEVQAVFGDLIDIAERHRLEVPLLRAVTNILRSIDHVAFQGAKR